MEMCKLSFLDTEMAINDIVSHCNCLVSLTKYKWAEERLWQI